MLNKHSTTESCKLKTWVYNVKKQFDKKSLSKRTYLSNILDKKIRKTLKTMEMRKGNLLVAKQNQVKRINESKVWAEVFVDIMSTNVFVDKIRYSRSWHIDTSN